MLDISVGGAFLATQPLPLGEKIRVEIEGECSAFTMDAVVMRSSGDRDGNSLVGIRFVDRDANSYSDWLEDECVRVSIWMCRESAPLIATKDPVIPEFPNDRAFIPLHFVFEIVRSQPGTSLSALLRLNRFDRMSLRIAVARLIESGVLEVMKPASKAKDAPSPSSLMRRISKSLHSVGL